MGEQCFCLRAIFLIAFDIFGGSYLANFCQPSKVCNMNNTAAANCRSRASQKSNGKASISRWTKWISTHLIRAPGSLPSSDASWERRRPLRFRWPIWRKEMWLRLYQKNSTKKWKESSLICRMGDLQYLCKLKKKTKKKRPVRICQLLPPLVVFSAFSLSRAHT